LDPVIEARTLDVDGRVWTTPLTGLSLQHGGARLRPGT
jgi:hypothetical protein